MNSSTRGAARVSIVWIIAAGVLVLVALAFGFVQSSDLGNATKEQEAAELAQAAAEEQADTLSKEVRSLSEAIGWYDRENANPRSDVEAIQAGLASLKGTFSDLGDSATDMEKAVPAMIAAYNTRGETIAELRSQLKQKDGEIKAARDAASQTASNKSDELRKVTEEASDAAKTSESTVAELERRVNQLTSQNSDLDLELRRERQSHADTKRTHTKELATYRTRLTQMGDTLAFTQPGNAELPDGEILAVSDQLNIGFINRGTRDRVARGMRFQVVSATPGDSRVKAWAEVIETSPDTAKVQFSDLRDSFDPVVTGDHLVNELYDPEGGRNAVLVGRFDATYNRKELELLLDDIGITVQPAVSATTHYLIVGSEMWMDENGDMLDEPLQPSEMPEYKDAEALGVHVVPLQNVREFFSVKRS